MINYSIVIKGTKPGTKTEDITETKAYGVVQISGGSSLPHRFIWSRISCCPMC